MYKLKLKDCGAVVDRAATAFVEYCVQNNIHWSVTGCSGGRDSFVTMGILRRAKEIAAGRDFELNNLGVVIPINSSQESIDLGWETIRMFGADGLSAGGNYLVYCCLQERVFSNNIGSDHLDDMLRALLLRSKQNRKITQGSWQENCRIAQGNDKARLRMITLFNIAKKLEGIVMSTDNLSELWMGFWTLHGDVGNFGLIQQMLKGLEIETLVKHFGASNRLRATKPDDGLGIGNGDEDQLGAPYPIIDRVMIELIQKGFDPDGSLDQIAQLPKIKGAKKAIVEKLAWRALKTAFKRREGGCRALSREQLGLPAIIDIKL
jgi:nicotinamide-nucleotide amidase